MTDLNANDVDGGDAPDRGHRPLAWASKSSASPGDRSDPRGLTPGRGRPRRWGRPARPTDRRNHNMARHGKKYLEAAKLVDREQVYQPLEAVELAKATTFVAFDAIDRGAPPTRRRPAPRRPDGPRHGRPPARHRQDRPRRRLRPGREGPGGAARRRRRGRRRGPGQEDRGRLARVRRRDRDARLDGHGRQARQDPRPARPDAEPQGRARSRSTSSGRSRRSRAAASSSASTRPPSSTRRSARAASSRPALVDNLAALVDAINRAKPTGAKGQYLRNLTIANTMGPGIRVDVPGVLAAAVA